MTDPVPAKPDPVCPSCGHPLNCYSGKLVNVRAMFEQVHKDLREQPARERKYAVGYGWTPEAVCAARLAEAPALERIVVAVYPREAAEETGIVVAGRDADGDCYVLADYSKAVKPGECMYVVMEAQRKYGADAIIGVTNLVGDYLGALWHRTSGTISTGRECLPAFKGVAVVKGILDRLKPIGVLYEQGAVHHVGAFPELEERMFTWMPWDRKPMGRIEALVVALTELTGNAGS